jgi:hypothetical protein
MVSSNVQEIYDAHVAGLSAGERLRLVELITRGMAQPQLDAAIAAAAEAVAANPPEPVPVAREMPGWQAGDRRGDRSEWRDRAL